MIKFLYITSQDSETLLPREFLRWRLRSLGQYYVNTFINTMTLLAMPRIYLVGSICNTFHPLHYGTHRLTVISLNIAKLRCGDKAPIFTSSWIKERNCDTPLALAFARSDLRRSRLPTFHRQPNIQNPVLITPRNR